GGSSRDPRGGGKPRTPPTRSGRGRKDRPAARPAPPSAGAGPSADRRPAPPDGRAGDGRSTRRRSRRGSPERGARAGGRPIPAGARTADRNEISGAGRNRPAE